MNIIEYLIILPMKNCPYIYLDLIWFNLFLFFIKNTANIEGKIINVIKRNIELIIFAFIASSESHV